MNHPLTPIGTDGPVAIFEKQHGPDSILVNGIIYYATGAWRENSSFPVLAQPHNDPVERQKAIIRFHELMLRKETQVFDDYKTNATSFRSSISEQEVAHLKKLQAAVRARQALIEGKRKELLDLELAPYLKDFNERLESAENALEEADSQLEKAHEEDLPGDQIEIVENQIKRIESKICRLLLNLHAKGGEVPKRHRPLLKGLLQQRENARLTTQAVGSRRLNEARNINV
ncbi:MULTISPECIES: hypothetical protein [Rhodopirellula]|uniref:hypothetical protein n=1 Tax=Rhodopirellula TaxID=265488 RepID=UPI00257F6433|nr:hypothetical protein [Rhodopirellula sp. UBA1907]|tara:strand:+ start:1013 stop:1702 length:690 start_codon:yes stop_codon:yes gene_type:complete